MRHLAVGILFTMLLMAGSCRRPFDGPDVHYRGLSALPADAQGIAGAFLIPATVDQVYYFSDSSLRCDYYLRVHFPDEETYRAYKDRMLTKRALVPAKAADPPELLRKRFGDWWDWQSRPAAESFAVDRGDPALPLLDFVIFDDAERLVFCLTGED